MTIIRFNTSLPKSTNSIFADYLSEFPVKSQFNPKVDVIEDLNSFELSVALAGFRKEDIQVEIDENKLTISGERKRDKNEDTTKIYHLIESEFGTFSRTFTLPKNAKTNAIEANYKDGILNLIIPKEERENKKSQITVN